MREVRCCEVTHLHFYVPYDLGEAALVFSRPPDGVFIVGRHGFA